MIIPQRDYDRIMNQFNWFRDTQDTKRAIEEIELLGNEMDNLPEAMMIDAVMRGHAVVDDREKPLDEFIRSLT